MIEALDLYDDPQGSPSDGHDAAAAAARQRFRALLAAKCDVTATSDAPLGTYTLQWLEDRGRPAALLEVGKLVRPHLDAFLDGRPALAWLDHLDRARRGGADAYRAAQVRRALSNPYLGLYLSLPSPYLCRRAGADPLTTLTPLCGVVFCCHVPAHAGARHVRDRN
jgi:hypothetical protein